MSKADLRTYILEHRENDKPLTMKFSLFSQVQLTQNIPQLNLKKGSIGTIVEYYTWHGHGLRFSPPESPNTGGL
jgi:hypothetical protein